jgi:hypothetical protein
MALRMAEGGVRGSWHGGSLGIALLLLGAGPLSAAPAPQDPPLAREDHTRIVYVVYANAGAVRRKVDTARPTGVDVLRAALKVETIDTYTKARIETVLRVLPDIELGQEKISADERAALEEIAARMAASPTITTRVQLLDQIDAETQPNGKYARFSGVNSGLTAAGRNVSDGLTTIYSVDWVYTALSDSPVKLLVHGGAAPATTEIGGGAAADFSRIWALTKDVFASGVVGAMRGAAGYYAAHLKGPSVFECATAKAIGDSAREIVSQID